MHRFATEPGTDVDADEEDCEHETEATIEGEATPAGDEVTLGPEEDAELDRMLGEAEPGARAAPPGLGPRGGTLAGSEAPIQIAMRIGVRNGLKITSRKRSKGSTESDHHVSQTRSSAADMSNGRNEIVAFSRLTRRSPA